MMHLFKMHFVYRITNKLDGKNYIGQTIDPEKRWSQHKAQSRRYIPGQVISDALKKHGVENFIFEIIACCKLPENIDCLEEELIKQYRSHINYGQGYNISLGGMTSPKTSEWKAKLSASNIGQKRSPEQRKRMSEAYVKRPLTKEGRQRLVAAALGNKYSVGLIPWNKGVPLSEEMKQHLSNCNIGKHSSIATEIKKGQRISPKTEFQKGLVPWNKGKKGSVPWNKGIPRTEEFKLKFRKFTIEQEIKIAQDPRPARAIAKEYNCNKSTILEIRKRNKKF